MEKDVYKSFYDCIPEFIGRLKYEKDILVKRIHDCSPSLKAQLFEQIKSVLSAKLEHKENRGLFQYYISRSKDYILEWFVMDVAINHNILHCLNEMTLDDISEYYIKEIDDRLPITVSKMELKNHFMKLNSKNDYGEIIMEADDIEQLLKANFHDYAPVIQRKKYRPKTKKEHIKRFIYELYLNYYKYHIKEIRKYRFVEFLKLNFYGFENWENNILEKNLSKSRLKSYPF